MNTKQKILIVHNYYQIPGGEDTVVANEKQLLESQGHEVVLYTRNNSELNEYSKIEKICLPFTMLFSLKTYKEIRQLIKKEQIDIVHVHNTLMMISPSVYYAALNCKVPVVQTIHNFRMLCPGATFYREGHVCEECLEKGIHCAMKYNCYRNSKIQTLACIINTKIHRMTGVFGKINYICLTEFNKDKMLHLKQIKKDKIFVKPNFVKKNIDIVPYEQRTNQFIFAGRLEELKGVNVLLEAWKLLGKEAPKLIICGTGPMEEWCKQYIKENELSNVEMKGFVANIEVRQLVSHSKAFILPTRCYEGFPMTMAESFSVGTPVIGSDIGNVGNLIENGKNGMKFACGSAQSLCDTIENFIENPVELAQEYTSRYLDDENYKILLRIYEKISEEKTM